MSKDIPMQPNTAYMSLSAIPKAMAWSLRAWPPLLWQANRTSGLRFRHLSTRVTNDSNQPSCVTGQTMWGGSAANGEAGVAWDWVEIADGVVAMADPLAVVTNLRFIGDEGEVLTAFEAARFLNEIVHGLPWQHEVARALATPTQ